MDQEHGSGAGHVGRAGLVKRRGRLKALVAIARTLLVIIWHLLADRAARYDDLGDNYYVTTISTDRKLRSHIRQIEARGYNVALTPSRMTNPDSQLRFAAALGPRLFSCQLHS